MSQPTSRLLTYLQLFRAPNVFTAMADVFMGFLFTHASLEPAPVFLVLLAASSLLYVAGMILNDVFDVEQDAKERPERPIPSGRISLGWARMLGFQMLILGAALGWVASMLTNDPRAGVVASLLAAAVLLYDR
ncbi:MAG: UbiA family prenyltransferase, partial [Planctomycetales bacterium]